jgi:D-alanine-D-alanine ligase
VDSPVEGTLQQSRRIRVGVVFGGRSGEHEVSLASARSILANLDPSRYEAVPIGITKQGRWIVGGDPLSALTAGHTEGTTTAPMLPDPESHGLVRLAAAGQAESAQVVEPLDVVFPVLHGTYGEDGTIQGVFELAGVPYVGSGVLGSAVGMDKGFMKTQFRAAGLNVADWEMVNRAELERDAALALARVAERIGFPCFVKPANLGSSVGVSKARDVEGLERGLRDAARYDRRLLVERAVNARELECSVLGNDDPRASIVGEIRPRREFYDYRAKYIDDDSELDIPADIAPHLSERVRAMAVAAFRAVDAAGMARVDFFLDRDTGELLVNEINTIPGFTKISMYPKLWEATGLSYPDLVDRLIQLALERRADRDRNETSFAPAL